MDDREVQLLLFEAILHGNVYLLSDLLEGEVGKRLINLPGHGFSHTTIPEGSTLLHFAILRGDAECVKILVDNGADPNMCMHLAVELGNRDIVEYLLALPYVNLQIRDDRNRTCLEIAQSYDNPTKQKPNQLNQPNQTQTHQLYHLIKSKQDEALKFKRDFHSLIVEACSNGDLNLLQKLLDKYQQHILSKLPKTWSDSFTSIASQSIKDLVNWNSDQNEVSLLFKAASKGSTDICKILIDLGANPTKPNPTNYSPLYVAAYGGHCDTIKLLLENFPALVQEVTIEGWSPLHACCLRGHSKAASLLLNYSYPKRLEKTFLTRSGRYEYQFALDLNAQDAAGQTAVYLAVESNDEKMLDTLLQFNLKANAIAGPKTKLEPQYTNTYNSDTARNDSLIKHLRMVPGKSQIVPAFETKFSSSRQLDKIVRQFHKLEIKTSSSDNKKEKADQSFCMICPFEVDTYCDYNSKSALHLAVMTGREHIATTLLVHGANPNLPILSKDLLKNDSSGVAMKFGEAGLNWFKSVKSTCIKEACKLDDVSMVEILIRYGARDDDDMALQVACEKPNNVLISKLLTLKSSIDSEYRINKNCNVEFASRYKSVHKFGDSVGVLITTPSSMFPTNPVMLNWQNLKCVRHIDPQWIIEASLCHNKKLKNNTTSLLAITRLDLSGNNLKTIHPVIFRLPSLKQLDLSRNRIESLLDYGSRGSIDSTSKLIRSHKVALKRSKSNSISLNLETSNLIDLNEIQDWDLPYLETLDLKDNQLISLPDCIFMLPRLKELDVSNNQIRQLPWSMWFASMLTEVIASENLLDDLPRIPTDNSSDHTNDEPTTHYEETDSSDQESSLEVPGNDQAADIKSDKIHQDILEASKIQLQHLNHWAKKVDIVNLMDLDDLSAKTTDSIIKHSCIKHLNLSQNAFKSIPLILSCVTPELERLNLSYNRLVTLGPIKFYPSKLKNLDVSRNQLTSWFEYSIASNQMICQMVNVNEKSFKDISSQCWNSDQVSLCLHKIHTRLDHLKSLNLSFNKLKKIIMTYDKPGDASMRNRAKIDAQILYPNITTLDLSNNYLSNIPTDIIELKDLSVLNLSNNFSLNILPPELGLSSKLWNLNIVGCNLNEPLKSIVESKNHKMMDIIGYLRSILEESKPYARMKLMLVGPQGIGKTSLLELLRSEGTHGYKRRVPEHWTKRMGHSNRNNIRNQRGITLSTVGIDIHDWVFEKKVPRSQKTFGPVSFSTWDFGGQDEFYATHRYFLSKRSIYLVVWRLTDGLAGIAGIQQWLVNIQSRAPGSPVIIVGTHEDLIAGGEQGEVVASLKEKIKQQFMNVMDPEKCGFPHVMDSIVVSVKTKLNIKHLCNRIYDVVFSLRCPGSSERLLEQKIPASYLYLEEIVGIIVNDMHQKRRDPVLNYTEYKQLTSTLLKAKYNKVFRDLEPINSKEINYNNELHQATRFLHDNGVLLHYEDANLRDLYFLDAQWLSDVLAAVVSIKEINPYVKNGLMKIDDLSQLFKSVSVNLAGGVQNYIVNLLNKFEVALTWNAQYLLIPSLLPPQPNALNRQSDFQVRLKLKNRGRSAVRRWEPNKRSARASSVEQRPKTDVKSFEFDSAPDRIFTRIILLRYLPAGFFARLQSSILSDTIFEEVCSDIYTHLSDRLETDDSKLKESLGERPSWICWKSGINLRLHRESTINCCDQTNVSLNPSPPLFEITESMIDENSIFHKKTFMIEKTRQDEAKDSDSDTSQANQTLKKEQHDQQAISAQGKWMSLDTKNYSSSLTIKVFHWRLKIVNEGGVSQFIDLDKQQMAKILATLVDQIDNLLEDWYPSLGTRFVHTFGGNYLVIRIVPCLKCISRVLSTPYQDSDRQSTRQSRQSRHESSRHQLSSKSEVDALLIHCFYVEQCILHAYDTLSGSRMSEKKSSFSLTNSIKSAFSLQAPIKKEASVRPLECPAHGSISVDSIAPDIIFEDVPDHFKINSDVIQRCKLIGRGAFGFVFRGTINSSGTSHLKNENHQNQASFEIALKLLQPVEPGSDADTSDQAAYKSAQLNWVREPFQSACKSYCTARHELNILQTLSHPNIVLFIGVTIRPLAIILELAPLGSMDVIFKDYKRAGLRINKFCVQKTILQVAKALEYLHQQRVIYRDLKCENVLVWKFPSTFATNQEDAEVELKLADYGISRQALPTGIKGFGGTIGFLAPEILRHNGDEEYTEKVDCFSFGVFIYELLTLQPPFKPSEGIRRHLSDGGRPILLAKDSNYPSYIIDLMIICCAQEPHNRPTASQIVSIASTPEFMQLLDIVAIDNQPRDSMSSNTIFASIVVDTNAFPSNNNLELWIGGKQALYADVLTAIDGHWLSRRRIKIFGQDLPVVPAEQTAICMVGCDIWICDSKMRIQVLKSSKSSDEERAFVSYRLNLPDLNGCYVKQIAHVSSTNNIAILTSQGTIFISSLPDINFVRVLDDDSILFLCMTIETNQTKPTQTIEDVQAEKKSNNHSFKIWCGQSNGVSCLEISNRRVCRQSILPMNNSTNDNNDDRPSNSSQQISTTDISFICSRDNLLWTASSCTVHLWNIDKRCVSRKLDCSKLVPCSESLESISIENYYEESRSSRVTSIAYLNDHLFVGTSHGCVIVIESDSLDPLTVFKPYESSVTILVPKVYAMKNDNSKEDNEHQKQQTASSAGQYCKKRQSLALSMSLSTTPKTRTNDDYIITIGSDYRDLMKRYVGVLDASSTGQDWKTSEVAILWSSQNWCRQPL